MSRVNGTHRIASACTHLPQFATIKLCRSRLKSNPRTLPPLKAARGNEITCKAWPQEAAMRMLMNNLDEEVAERPRDLVVYGGTGKAPRGTAVAGGHRRLAQVPEE